MFAKLKAWFHALYLDLIAFKEDPHQIALSFAMGVFLGILPFTGVLAAITLAYIFKLNKPAAILGSALTNTWLGLIVLGGAIHIGALCLRLNGQDVQAQLQALIHDFHWHDVFTLSFLKLLLPVVVGYLILSFVFALLGYVLTLVVIHWHRRK